MNIDVSKLLTNWYENEKGEVVQSDSPDARTYHSKFPCQVKYEICEYHPNDPNGNIFRPMATFTTTYGGQGQECIVAMVNSGDYTLANAIRVYTAACERCSNVLIHKYLKNDGYEEHSAEWYKSNTCCDFCKGDELDMSYEDYLKRNNDNSEHETLKVIGAVLLPESATPGNDSESKFKPGDLTFDSLGCYINKFTPFLISDILEWCNRQERNQFADKIKLYIYNHKLENSNKKYVVTHTPVSVFNKVGKQNSYLTYLGYELVEFHDYPEDEADRWKYVSSYINTGKSVRTIDMVRWCGKKGDYRSYMEGLIIAPSLYDFVYPVTDGDIDQEYIITCNDFNYYSDQSHYGIAIQKVEK